MKKPKDQICSALIFFPGAFGLLLFYRILNREDLSEILGIKMGIMLCHLSILMANHCTDLFSLESRCEQSCVQEMPE